METPNFSFQAHCCQAYMLRSLRLLFLNQLTFNVTCNRKIPSLTENHAVYFYQEMFSAFSSLISARNIQFHSVTVEIYFNRSNQCNLMYANLEFPLSSLIWSQKVCFIELPLQFFNVNLLSLLVTRSHGNHY